MKILILKPSSLGDVVQALPVLRLLKSHDPTHQIHWWLSTELLGLLEGDPDLSGIFPFERRRWAHPRNWGELLRSLRDIRRQQFDWVIDLQGLARSGAVAWLTQARLSIGVEDWREGAVSLYDVAVPRPSPSTHAVDWYLQVLSSLQVPVHTRFTWLPPRPEAARAIAAKWRPAGTPWVALHPGARWSNKRWPVEHYAEVVRSLAAKHANVQFAVLGGKSDASLGAAIASVTPARCLDLTGQTSLSELIEWLRRCALIITNDTGPMHIAAALSIPIIGLFGPTNPKRTGPYGQVHRTLQAKLPCAPCMSSRCHYPEPLACLRGITPATVCARAWQILTNGASGNVSCQATLAR